MDLHIVFLSLGGLLLVGVVADSIGRRTRLPRVSLMILLGVAIGPSGFDLIPRAVQGWYDFLATAALTMVAFLLGGRFSGASLRAQGRTILTVSLTAVLLTAIIVGGGLMMIGTPTILALLLAGIATATAPAATQDVVKQLRARGPFTDTLLGVVAIDDAWGLILFSFLLTAATALAGNGSTLVFWDGLREVAGAIAVGALVGVPAAGLTGRLRAGEPILMEALGVVFLCAGLAIWAGVSFLLAGMVAGVIVTNFARHHRRPFHEIEQIELPFMVLFFVLAGAALEISALQQIGLIGLSYLVLRTVSRIAGGWIGARLAGLPPRHANWLGFALIPQAGVALGMALIAAQHFPELAQSLLAITVGTTVLFELFGPLFTQAALNRVGETKPNRSISP